MRRLAATIVFSLIAIVVGCGDDGGSSSTPASTLAPTLDPDSRVTINCLRPNPEVGPELSGTVELPTSGEMRNLIEFWRTTDNDADWHHGPGVVVFEEDVVGQLEWGMNLQFLNGIEPGDDSEVVFVVALYPVATLDGLLPDDGGSLTTLPAGYTAISDEFAADLSDPQNPTPPCP